MHEKYHRDFIIDKGGSSVEGLKAVTGKPKLQLKRNTISEEPHLLVSTAKAVADAYDKFVPFYSLGLAFQT